jgi:hypothetical protein
LDSHNQLINWLFDEVFDPGMDRLPILGKVEEIKGRTFGECQKLLILYLEVKSRSHLALEDSITVIKFYYETFKSQVEVSLQHIGNNLNLSLRKLVQNSIRSDLIIGEKVDGMDEDAETEGSLNVMMPLEKFPRCLKPGALKRELSATLDKEEEDILEKFNQLSLPDT